MHESFKLQSVYNVTEKLHEPSQLQLFELHLKATCPGYVEALSMYDYTHSTPYLPLFPPFYIYFIRTTKWAHTHILLERSNKFQKQFQLPFHSLSGESYF